MKVKWVIKFITRKEWDEYYKHYQVYALINKVKGGYRIGFCVAGDIPFDCVEATEEDLKEIRKYRENNNIRPLPEIV